MTREYDIDEQANWDSLQYCPRCAGELTEREVRGNVRVSCDHCGYVFYTPPAPVTCVLAARDGKVLLVRRKYPPKAGQWCLPAGFIEAGEPPSECAAREALEETGMELEITGIVDSWASNEDPRTPIVCFAFTGRVTGGTLRPGDDESEAAFFGADELPDDIAFSAHRSLVERHFSERNEENRGGREAPAGQGKGASE